MKFEEDQVCNLGLIKLLSGTVYLKFKMLEIKTGNSAMVKQWISPLQLQLTAPVFPVLTQRSRPGEGWEVGNRARSQPLLENQADEQCCFAWFTL